MFTPWLVCPDDHLRVGWVGVGGPPPPHCSSHYILLLYSLLVRVRLYFVIVFLVGEGGTQGQKKLKYLKFTFCFIVSEFEIYLFLLYSCSKILAYMILSNRTINTQIWCLFLDQVCPNEHHLPVPFLIYIVTGMGWVGDGGHPPPPHCSSHQL